MSNLAPPSSLRPQYPFAALVGQQTLKQALLLCAVNPAIGGVLVQGDKGTAKSTAARGLAALMPWLSTVAGCSFNCAPTQPSGLCGACTHAVPGAPQLVPAPFVDLPLGATEDRVLGSLDLEGVLVERQRKLQPGLLAAAHRGILYIDEVNLLPDHLVDVLLDVAAMGVNTVQREGLSVSHPAHSLRTRRGRLRRPVGARSARVATTTSDCPLAAAHRADARRAAHADQPTVHRARGCQFAGRPGALQNGPDLSGFSRPRHRNGRGRPPGRRAGATPSAARQAIRDQLDAN